MSEAMVPMTGGCLCGAVRYEATVPPTNVSYCHCRMCQRWSGSAIVVAAKFPQDAFTITQGQPEFYKSSDIGERGFCTRCGTPLIFRYVGMDAIYVSVGTLDHPEDAPPTLHMGIESQVPWLSIEDDLPRHHTDDVDSFKAAKAAADKGEG